VKAHQPPCTFWLGRHKFSGSGLWVYLETILPHLIERVLTEGCAVRVIGAGNEELAERLELILGEASSKIEFVWLKNPLGLRYLGHLQDIFYLGRFSGIFHGFSNVIPLFGGGDTNIVTLHDLFQAFPPSAPRGLIAKAKARFYRMMFRLLFGRRKLAAVVTDLEDTTHQLRELYPVPKVVTVIHPPLAEHFRTRSDLEQSESCEREDILLAFGSVDPRKNFPRILQAYKKFQTGAELHVVLANSHAESIISEQIRSSGIEGSKVTIHHHPDNDTLCALYREASVTLFPSLAEGFGYPIYESLSQGTPVLTSVGLVMGSLRVSQELLETCNPHSVDDIQRGIQSLLSLKVSPTLRDAVISEVQAALSPEKYVAQLVGCYFSVAKNARLCEVSQEFGNGLQPEP